MSDDAGLIITGGIGAIFFIVVLLDCCIDNTPKITKVKRMLRRRSRQSGSIALETENTVPRQSMPSTTNLINGNFDADEQNAMTGAGTGPPYPVEAQHPIPQTGPTQTVFTHNPPYPRQNPHPIASTTPYPPAATPYPPIANATPYPPTGPPIASSAPFPDYSGNPPSYSEAVGELPVHPPPLKEGYSKQSPYNPNY